MIASPVTVASAATAEALELPALLALCAALGASDLGRERILKLAPLTSEGEVKRRQSLLLEAGFVLLEAVFVPSQEEPLAPLIEGLRSGEPGLAGIDVVRLATILDWTTGAATAIESCAVEVPGLETLVAGLPTLEDLRRRIFKSLDKRGRVRDDASPQLVRLRSRVHRLREGLYKQLHETLSGDREHFAADTVSLKEGRLTLMLQSGAKGRVKGLVHGRSGTGQSLYFEPMTAVEGNNNLQETLEQEEAERQRILVELVAECQANRAAFEAHFELIAELDLLQSLHRFAVRSGARFPEIATAGQLRLVGARHPLLDPELASLREVALGKAGHRDAVVPLDVELDQEHRVLVITGPNAGGKTVALKTVGLLALAAQSGIPVPLAAGSRIPLFDTVMAMVGDEQDLLTDRSTFSARLMRLKEAWEIASDRSLVLLDELGSGTDPEEGSALALALLERLLDSRSLAVLTTHLTQLAAMALERSGASCAAMEFDPDSGRPTYRLRPGAPGGSQALALGRRLGLPDRWLRRAESLLGAEHRDLRRLLAEVEGVRQQLAASQADLERETDDLRKIRGRLEAELAAAGDERRQLGRRVEAELDTFRMEVTRRLRQEIDLARQQVDQGRKRNLVGAAVGRLFADAPTIATGDEEPGAPLVEGSTVRHRSLGWIGQLDRIRSGRADVQVLGKRIRCSLDDLVGVGESAVSGRDSKNRPTRYPSVDDDEIPAELNLVGTRVEPALDRLDRYLDQALLAGRRQVRIVHGFGTGRLRRAVREHLEPHPAVVEFRPGGDNEGGDGATVVTLDRD